MSKRLEKALLIAEQERRKEAVKADAVALKTEVATFIKNPNPSVEDAKRLVVTAVSVAETGCPTYSFPPFAAVAKEIRDLADKHPHVAGIKTDLLRLANELDEGGKAQEAPAEPVAAG